MNAAACIAKSAALALEIADLIPGGCVTETCSTFGTRIRRDGVNLARVTLFGEVLLLTSDGARMNTRTLSALDADGYACMILAAH